MKNFPLLRYLSTFFIVSVLTAASWTVRAGAHDTHGQSYSLPLTFVENQGQIDNSSVRFYARTLGSTAFLTEHGEMVYAFRKTDRQSPTQGWVLRERLLDASVKRISGDHGGTAAARICLWRGSIAT